MRHYSLERALHNLVLIVHHSQRLPLLSWYHTKQGHTAPPVNLKHPSFSGRGNATPFLEVLGMTSLNSPCEGSAS